MNENDPTAVDPNEEIEAFETDPPAGFEPQPPLQDGQDEGIVEREDVIETAETAEPDLHQEEDGEADDGDDDADEGDD